MSDLVCLACSKGHYIKADKESIRLIRTYVKENGSTNEKERFRAHTELFDITESLEKYLTTFDVKPNFPLHDLEYLMNEPARIVIENANKEWDVYKHIIDIYKSDKQFSDIFTLLKKAKDEKRLKGDHAGGTGEIKDTVDREPYMVESKNIRLKKTLALFDRDTDDNLHYDGNKNSLFKFFSGKDYTEIKEEDIYTLNQDEPFWHMWYKRAIENYFPDVQYVKAGFDVSGIRGLTLEERDYKLLGGNKTHPALIRGYKKDSVKSLVNGLSREQLERSLKKFNIDGMEISEMQLFLLKMVRIL
ncbi:MAG: hypothetical protein K2M63_06135 [Muribaculaceae bacterium]|nr:hypothetical protein [Muribaculaceae bacterium]